MLCAARAREISMNKMNKFYEMLDLVQFGVFVLITVGLAVSGLLFIGLAFIG
jgi:hypothetical protein